MSTFDPTKPARVHDQLNDRWIDWDPAWAPTFQYEPWSETNPHLVNWDGRLLDGWEPVPLH